MCRCDVQRRCACGNYSGHRESHSGIKRKPFAFPPESLFVFSPESCSPSPRNAFRVHPGILFVFARNPQYELIALDEVGYVPLADIGAEFLFQVISDRAERAAIIVTTNLPFSEWTTVFPNPRLCKALLDRITDRAHIIETGTESFRFRRTMEKRKKH